MFSPRVADNLSPVNADTFHQVYYQKESVWREGVDFSRWP